jgi:valyl-tRNA synthetase
MIDDILDLISYIKHCEVEGTNKNKVVLLGGISQITYSQIKEQSGIDLTGFQISIDAYEVKHVLQGHGDKKRENKRGQEAVNEEDFELMVKIVNNPEIVFFDGTDRLGRDCFQFQSTFESKYVIIMEVRTGRKQLALKTMRIFTIKKENQD